MRTLSVWTLALASAALLVVSAPSFALDPPPGRVELKRADLSGAPGMEVISSITEFKPGETVAMHMHNGIEAGYVIQGAMIQAPVRRQAESKPAHRCLTCGAWCMATTR